MKIFFCGRGAVAVQHFDIRTDQPRGEFAGIGDRRGRENELRVPAVKSRDALEPAQHVGQMAAENAAIHVQLIDHDIAQIFEQARPLRVVRQDPAVQHVRIGKDDVSLLADGSPRIGRSVAVIGENAEWSPSLLPKSCNSAS